VLNIYKEYVNKATSRDAIVKSDVFLDEWKKNGYSILYYLGLYLLIKLPNHCGLNRMLKLPMQAYPILLFHSSFYFVENQHCVQPKYVINFKTDVIFPCGIGVLVESIAESKTIFDYNLMNAYQLSARAL
jgi:hypothetical protein